MVMADSSKVAPSPEFVRDLLSSDGQPRAGDDNPTGLGEALRPLPLDLQRDVAAALWTHATERLTVAEEAEARAKYIPPHEFRARNLVTAERLARLWREAVHDRSNDASPQPGNVSLEVGYTSVHEQAAAVLLDPYLQPEPPPNYDGWHMIDNADADDVRHALEVAILRLRKVAPLARDMATLLSELDRHDRHVASKWTSGMRQRVLNAIERWVMSDV